MTPSERFAELWTDYLEGELTEARFHELRELLAHDPGLLSQAADLYQTHRLLGLLGRNAQDIAERFIQQTVEKLPDNSDRFTGKLMQRLQRQLPGSASGPQAASVPFAPIPSAPVQTAAISPVSRRWQQVLGISGWLVAVLTLLLSPYLWQQQPASEQTTGQTATVPVHGETDGAEGKAPVAPRYEVLFSSLARAQFFGELTPGVESALVFQKEYILMSGLVELLFPSGATTIIEAPAIFRVPHEEGLVLDVGLCSVHAPEGAEGFRVETPGTKVIDRGTRFSVNVTETSETEVQVIEGAADIYRKSPEQTGEAAPSQEISIRRRLTAHHAERNSALANLPDSVKEIRLTDQQALRLLNDKTLIAEAASFNPAAYRSQLPDRLIRYPASLDEEDRAEFLTSVTLQRGGQEVQYSAEQLTSVDVYWFKANPEKDRNGHLAWGDGELPEFRVQGLSDRSLITGVINPGGSPQPLTGDPLLHHDPAAGIVGTPGMAIRFHRPVINRPGPDIVFIEIQPLSTPPDGDAFHISPVKFGKQRRALTIQNYDLGLTSAEALRVKPFYLFPFQKEAESLEDLQQEDYQRRPAGVGFRAVAVGIDLSDMGFEPGEAVTELFIQDAGNDDYLVDPVYIGGLP